MSMVSERKTASASTSDHQPMPITATRSLRVSAGPGFDCVMTLLACCASMLALRGPRRADRLDGFARDAGVSLPIAAADPDAADAFSLDEHREAARHGGPPLRARSERQPDRVGDIERLRLRAPGRGRTLVRGRTDRLSGG